RPACACGYSRFPLCRSGSIRCEQGARGHRELLDDRTERERGEEGQAADDHDHADHQTDEQAAGGRKGASRRRNRLLFRERAGDGHGRDDHPEPADQHRDGAGEVVEEDVSAQARERRAVVAGLRGVGIEDLGEAVRPRIVGRGNRNRNNGSDRGPAEIHQRQDQDGEHRHLHLLGLFLPTYSGVRPTIRPATKIDTMTNSSIPYMPAPTPPTMISPSWMLIRGIMPPSAVNESCMALTAPQEAAVVMTANSEDAGMPKRTSLPSILPPVSPIAVNASLPWPSAQ